MKIKKVLFIAMAVCSTLLYSCQPDDNTDPSPTDARDNVTGMWACSENSTAYGQQNYDVEIIKDPANSGNIQIDNFFGLGDGKKVSASMSNLNLTIPTQTVDNTTFSGSGTISSNYKNISFTYTFNEGNGPENVNSTYTKKP
jgi:hypothetical protein